MLLQCKTPKGKQTKDFSKGFKITAVQKGANVSKKIYIYIQFLTYTFQSQCKYSTKSKD